jgi:hypothetical protein
MKQQSKRFFFEKKKQKTFANGPVAVQPARSKGAKFFLLLFCSQKRSSYTNHHGFRPMAEDQNSERKSWMPAFAGMTWGGQRVKAHAGSAS